MGMKTNRTCILLFIFLLFCGIFYTGCGKRTKSPHEVVDTLKQLRTYTCRADITVKNDKQEITYTCRQFFDRSIGYRLELGEDRVQVYKDNQIYVHDKKNKAKYTLEEDFDQLYSLSFVGRYIMLLYTNKEIKYSSKTEKGINYELVELLIPGNNRNLHKAVMYINKATYHPERVIVYNKRNAETARIVYQDFQVNTELDKNLFTID
jgi:outer membrane lipoprotein-sorting protein